MMLLAVACGIAALATRYARELSGGELGGTRIVEEALALMPGFRYTG